jgi:uncharacterized RDD family membrane protein YckC
MNEDQDNTGIERHLAEEQELASAAMDWRNEVASRVDSYKTRRSRKRLAGEFSMKLDFGPKPRPNPARGVARTEMRPEARIGFAPPAAPDPGGEPPAEPAAGVEAVIEARAVPVAEPDSRPQIEQSPLGPGAPLPPPLPPKPWHKEEGWTILAPPRTVEGKVIEFPRAPLLPPIDELAEVISDRPRILDTPEMEAPEPPPLAELSLIVAGDEEQIAPPPPELELPLQVASLPQRAMTAICDTLLVIAACGVFGAIAHQMCPALPKGKTTIAALAMVPVILWTSYHYLFYVYAGLTPGMKLASLRLNAFDGGLPRWSDRRMRALMLALSCASLGLGFAWALVDEDQLCWHDRITRTYLTQG